MRINLSEVAEEARTLNGGDQLADLDGWVYEPLLSKPEACDSRQVYAHKAGSTQRRPLVSGSEAWAGELNESALAMQPGESLCA